MVFKKIKEMYKKHKQRIAKEVEEANVALENANKHLKPGIEKGFPTRDFQEEIQNNRYTFQPFAASDSSIGQYTPERLKHLKAPEETLRAYVWERSKQLGAEKFYIMQEEQIPEKFLPEEEGEESLKDSYSFLWGYLAIPRIGETNYKKPIHQPIISTKEREERCGKLEDLSIKTTALGNQFITGDHGEAIMEGIANLEEQACNNGVEILTNLRIEPEISPTIVDADVTI